MSGLKGMVPWFLFHGKVIPLLIMDSENVTVERLAVDYERPYYSEGRRDQCG